jgi:uncharacterized protein (TIGR03083 family)
MLDAASIRLVLDVYRPERAALLELLGEMDTRDWVRRTECPAYSVKGLAAHVLGDDLSLLSRQRDEAENGLSQLSAELPNADFRTLLDTFNDRWVTTVTFFSTRLLMELLQLSGEWTAAYYAGLDPEAPGESVGIFGAQQGASSPCWQAIAREFIERWIHHSQIRRAIGQSSLADRQFLVPGVEVAAAVARLEPGIPESQAADWTLGPIVLGPSQQAADILTRAHSVEEVQRLATGPADAVRLLAAVTGRT